MTALGLPRRGRFTAAERAEYKRRLFVILERRATEGKTCPTNIELADGLHIGTGSVERFMTDLAQDGLIIWRKTRGTHRTVIIVASGLSTGTPPRRMPESPLKRAARTRSFLLPSAKSGVSDKQLYGPIEYAVKVLRRRGFVVFREGGGVRVGHKLLQPQQVEQIAARERRLTEAR